MIQLVASLTVVASLTAMMSLQSCNRQPLPDQPVTLNVTFDKDIKPITSTVCIKCHSTGNRDFSEYHNAFQLRYTIYSKVVLERTMPFGMYMSNQDRALFRDWVNQGGNK